MKKLHGVVVSAIIMIFFCSCSPEEPGQKKISSIGKKITRIKEDVERCKESAARESGSEQGFRLLATKCYRERSGELAALESERNNLIVEDVLGIKR